MAGKKAHQNARGTDKIAKNETVARAAKSAGIQDPEHAMNPNTPVEPKAVKNRKQMRAEKKARNRALEGWTPVSAANNAAEGSSSATAVEGAEEDQGIAVVAAPEQGETVEVIADKIDTTPTDEGGSGGDGAVMVEQPRKRTADVVEEGWVMDFD